MKKAIIALGIIVLVLAGYILYQKFGVSPAINVLDYFIGRVDIIKPGNRIVPAAIKLRLHTKDTVKTHAKSKAFIQCGADNMLELFENTELRMDTLPVTLKSSADVAALHLMRGKAAVMLEKLTSKGSFSIRTINHTIAVRGTVFSAEITANGAIVMVKEGGVTITETANPKKRIDVDAGSKAIITGTRIETKDMTDGDAATFREIVELRPIAGINCTPPEYIERFFRWRLGLKDRVPAEPSGDEGAEKESTRGEDAAKDRDTPDTPDREAAKKETKDTAKDDKPAATSMARLGVNAFTANGVEQKVAADLTNKLYAKLRASKGVEAVVMRGGGRTSARQLMGRVSKLGATTVLALRVVDGQSGRLVYSRSLNYKDGEDIDGRLDEIAGQIGRKGEIWAGAK
ncbi:MAG TPA: FecR domain-containing protein [Spirochaetota bacterium]|nr:FecR domain-containing protein [Spirochaetota bacterium]HOS39711.1 FecR domain-containing protein [Spirochaetota bacterium]HPI24125.1 FecR domain-containing protein [Spirochaetota bacterium]HPU90480.1 FecR domain-containing protein [Spirochaetota bacterium]